MNLDSSQIVVSWFRNLGSRVGSIWVLEPGNPGSNKFCKDRVVRTQVATGSVKDLESL